MSEEFDAKQLKDCQEQIKKRNAEHAERAKQLRAKLVPKLRRKGVQSVRFEYDGCGDEGNLRDIIFEPQANAPKNISEVEYALWSVLAQHFPGFEIDEGGYGTITWNIATDRIKIEHEQNVTSTDSSVVEEI